MATVLKMERAAVPKSCCIRFKTMNARIGEMSSPPIAGIIPRNAFKYGSVIELTALNTGLLQARLGNQLKSTLTIKTRE